MSVEAYDSQDGAKAEEEDGANELKKARITLERFLYPSKDDYDFMPSAEEKKQIGLALKQIPPLPARYIGDGKPRSSFGPEDFAPAVVNPLLYDPKARIAKLRDVLDTHTIPANQRGNVEAAIEFIKSGRYRGHKLGPVVVFEDGEVKSFPSGASPWWAETFGAVQMTFSTTIVQTPGQSMHMANNLPKELSP